MTIGRDESFQGVSDAVRRQVEDRLNRELRKLKTEMDKTRCSECGFTGHQHQEWCPRGKDSDAKERL